MIKTALIYSSGKSCDNACLVEPPGKRLNTTLRATVGRMVRLRPWGPLGRATGLAITPHDSDGDRASDGGPTEPTQDPNRTNQVIVDIIRIEL